MKTMRMLLLLAAVGIGLNSNAQTNTWIGPDSGFWEDPSSWTNGLPGPNDAVFINYGNVQYDSSPSVYSLTVGDSWGNWVYLFDTQSSNTLSVAANATFLSGSYVQLWAGSTLSVAGVLQNDGTLDLENGLVSATTFVQQTGVTANVSSMSVGSFANNGGFFYFSGGVYWGQPGSSLNVDGTFTNTGAVFIDYGASVTLASPISLTDIPISYLTINGSFTSASGDPIANLTTLEGRLELGAQTKTITPIGGTLTLDAASPSEISLKNGTNLLINGNVYVGHDLYTDCNEWGCDGIGGNTLTVTGNVTNDPLGWVAIAGPGDVAYFGSLTNKGLVEVRPGAALHLTNQPGGITDVVAGSTYTIQGIFHDVVNNDSAFAHLTNINGTVTLDGTLPIQDNPIGGTLTIANGGTFNILNGSQFFVHGNVVGQPNGTIFIDPSSLTVSGTFTNNGANVIVDGGSVFRVGAISNAGPLLLTHNSNVVLTNGFYQLAGGTLGESIDATGFSIVTVNGGPVVLDGTLDILLDPNFTPTVGSFYKFLLFGPGSLQGSFAYLQNAIFNNGTEKWVVVYNNAGGYVELMAQSTTQPTPEPASCLLLGTGLTGLACFLRRRR